MRGRADQGWGDEPGGIILRACAQALQRILDVRSLTQHVGAVDHALGVVAQRLDTSSNGPGEDGPGWVDAAHFAAYRAVQHVAGAARVHPADLWPCRDPWLEIALDPFVVSRVMDVGVLDALEAALLALLRQTGPGPSEAMSELCAALGEGARAPLSNLWRMAAAVYEAQALGLMGPDVYLKRLGSRLLSMARDIVAVPGPWSPVEVRQRLTPLAHELLYFCAHAAAPPEGQAPRLGAVREALRAWRVAHPPLAVPQSAPPTPTLPAPPAPPLAPEPAQAAASVSPVEEVSPPAPSLLQAVPDLPSMADLDLDAAWDGGEPLPEDVRRIGPLRVPIARFNAFLADTDEIARRLGTLLAEWSVEAAGPPPQAAAQAARDLMREAASVGHDGLAGLCEALAQALGRAEAAPDFDPQAADLFARAHLQAERLLHAFAAGFLRPVDLGWVDALQAWSGVAPAGLGGDECPASPHPDGMAKPGDPRTRGEAAPDEGPPGPAEEEEGETTGEAGDSGETGETKDIAVLEAPDQPDQPDQPGATRPLPEFGPPGAAATAATAAASSAAAAPAVVRDALQSLRVRLRDAGVDDRAILEELERALAQVWTVATPRAERTVEPGPAPQVDDPGRPAA